MSKKHHHKKKIGGQGIGNSGKLQVAIHGMHCASCEVLIERKFKKIEGVEKVSVSQAAGRAEVTYSLKPSVSQLQEMLDGTEYTVEPFQQAGLEMIDVHRTTLRDYLETSWVFIIVVAIFFVLGQFNLVPKGLSVSDTMSYPFIFAIGLVAAVSSCIAVTGGLLVAVSSRYAESHPNLEGWQRFKPQLSFNIGRVVGYTILGGLVGELGSFFTLSTRMTGVLTIAASLVMIFLGFQLLNIFAGLRRFQPKMPKFIAHRVHDASGTSKHSAAPFGLGAATFFLPCGFTQALQLYVLSRGSFTVGALTMLAFSLGTMPALVSLSALSSFLKGAKQRYFFRFAGAIVVLLGIMNIGNGLALAGTNIKLATILANRTSSGQTAAELPPLTNGKQVMSMKVVGYEYQPAKFTVRQGVPVEWRIDGSQAAGCAGVVVVSDLNITVSLPRNGEKVVDFTPDKTGAFGFNCPMGMTTRGAAITVVANNSQSSGSPVTQSYAPITPTVSPSPVAGSPDVQKFTMTVTRDKGFYPNTFPAKKGTPVELLVDVQTDVSGCMGTMIGSDYDIAQQLKLGKNYVRFTPTKTGTLNLACPMGIGMGKFEITD